MAGNTGTLKIELEVDDKGTAVIKDLDRSTAQVFDRMKRNTKITTSRMGESLGVFTRKARKAFEALGRVGKGALTSITRGLFSLKGAIAAAGLGFLAKKTIDVASGFEKMQLSLDTLTKGEGEEWFRRLNEWALKMPVNTEKAIQSFTMMRAMGLQPSIEEMTTLVDTMSALGGQGDMLEGIARALGQIKTKGRVSTEELMQLAERGIPVFDILREKMGLTGEELGNIGNAGLDVEKTLSAIMEGLAERFGGQSEKMQGIWTGMRETIKSYWKEFQRLVMAEGGVMDYLKTKVKGIIDTIDEWRTSGQLQEWAEQIGQTIVEKLRLAVEWYENLKEKAGDVAALVKEKWEEVSQVLTKVWTLVKWTAKAFIAAGEALGKLAGWLSMLGQSTGEWRRAQAEANAIAADIGPGIAAGPSTEPEGAAAPAEPTGPPDKPPEDWTAAEVNQWGDQRGRVSINNYFAQRLSRSDVTNIITEQRRRAARG